MASKISLKASLFTSAFVHTNLYKDSVALMRVAQRLLAMPDVVNATLQMGNPANKEILQEAGLLSESIKNAGPSDIMVVVQAKTQKACDAAVAESLNDLAGKSAVSQDSHRCKPSSCCSHGWHGPSTIGNGQHCANFRARAYMQLQKP